MLFIRINFIIITFSFPLYTEEQSILILSLEHAWDMNKTWILHSCKEFLHVCQIPVHILYSPTSFWFPRLYVLSICYKNFLASSARVWFSVFHGGKVWNEGLRTVTQEMGNPNATVIIQLLRLPQYSLCTRFLSTHWSFIITTHEVVTILIIPILKMRKQRHVEVNLQGAGLGLNPSSRVLSSPPLIHTILPWVTGLSMAKEPWVSFPLPWPVASSSVKWSTVQVLCHLHLWASRRQHFQAVTLCLHKVLRRTCELAKTPSAPGLIG